jgi:meiotic recombination protein REC8
MLYLDENLTKNDPSYTIAWIMATRGKTSSHHRIVKKDILSVDLSRMCNSVASPKIPYALRFSSILLHGILTIYEQQVYYLLGRQSLYV